MAKHCKKELEKSSLPGSDKSPAVHNISPPETSYKLLHQTIEHRCESLMAEYDGSFHCLNPQETYVDRFFQADAVRLSLEREGPPSTNTCRLEAQSLAQQISTLHQKLNHLLSQQESLIFWGWRNKTEIQKQDVLLAVWPDMASTHRPDVRFTSTTECRFSSSSKVLWTPLRDVPPS